MPKEECYGCSHYMIDSPRCLNCHNYDLWIGGQSPQATSEAVSAELALLSGNAKPLLVVGELEKIVGYRTEQCAGCGWHPEVCKHCQNSLI